jgi:choline-sulfatase
VRAKRRGGAENDSDMAAGNGREPPNILFVMFDQMSAQSLPCYGHPTVRAPHLKSLAERGVVFDNAYCNAPLCSPSRFAMMTGRLPSGIGAYDNAAELPSGVPTFAHHLRALGYRTCLSGKMDFTGADQLHGYEERLTTDLSPSDFGWTPDWERPDARQPWSHDLASVVDAGPYDHSLAIGYDEEACAQAVRWLYESSDADDRPWLLTVSFMHPHDPYLAKCAFWDWYEDDAIDLPTVPHIAPEARDPHGRRLYAMYDRGEHAVTEAHLRRARRGYYAMISYVDALLGRTLAALDDLGQRDDTVIVATADHGDMLGERGLWYKMTFFERAVRVPLIISAPQLLESRRVTSNVSLVDMLPTLLSIAEGGDRCAMPTSIDGTSLMPLASGRDDGGPDTVHGEYMAEGTSQPIFMIRRGTYKYITCAGDPPQLYDLAADPLELTNLAGRSSHAAVSAAFAAEVERKWDSDAIRRQVIDSQRRRRVIHEALRTGRTSPWDYAPMVDASRQYFRNLGGDRGDPDRQARVPRRGKG